MPSFELAKELNKPLACSVCIADRNDISDAQNQMQAIVGVSGVLA